MKVVERAVDMGLPVIEYPSNSMHRAVYQIFLSIEFNETNALRL